MSLDLGTLKDIQVAGRKAISPQRTTSDGQLGDLWLSRDGALVTMDWYTAMALEGRVYNINVATPDTTMTAAVNYDATHPSVIAVAPAGTIMIPVFFNIALEDASGTDNHIIIGCDSANLYASGGTAVSSAYNIRTDEPNASAVTVKYASDSAITVTDPGVGERILYNYINAFADATTSPALVVDWQPKAPPVLVGPATFFVYVWAASTASEYEFSFQYIELPNNAIV